MKYHIDGSNAIVVMKMIEM